MNENRSANTADKKPKLKDQVEISSEAKELQEATGAVQTEEQVRRIEELKNSVSAGTYHVDARQLAEKLFPYFK
ncbi:Anti-sigma-28 factor, FlgM [compost metagenome]